MGCGKTTTLKQMKKIINVESLKDVPDPFILFLSRNCVFLHEPVEEFEKLPDSTYNPMEEGYAGSSADYLAMQLHILNVVRKRFLQVISQSQFRTKSADEPTIFISERGPKSCKIFARFTANKGELSDFAEHFFERMCDEAFDGIFIDPELVIFLSADTKLCLVRMLERGRTWERDVDHQDLILLQKTYRNALINDNDSGRNALHEIEVESEQTAEDVAFKVIKAIEFHLSNGKNIDKYQEVGTEETDLGDSDM